MYIHMDDLGRVSMVRTTVESRLCKRGSIVDAVLNQFFYQTLAWGVGRGSSFMTVDSELFDAVCLFVCLPIRLHTRYSSCRLHH